MDKGKGWGGGVERLINSRERGMQEGRWKGEYPDSGNSAKEGHFLDLPSSVSE